MEIADLGFELLHVGINSADAAEGKRTALLFAELFGLPLRETSGSVFAGEDFEIMKMPFRGTHGHLSIGTSDLPAARAWLESKGIRFDESSIGLDDKGNVKLIYSEDEIGGFAFHLTQKG